MDAMTQYGVEEPRVAFVESEDLLAATDNLLLCGDHVARVMTWTKPSETRAFKGELSHEDGMTSCKACKTHTRMARSCRLTAEGVARRNNPQATPVR